MKTKFISQFSVLNILAATLFAASPVRAQIIGINSGGSFATNAFVDNSSLNNLSQPGAVYVSSIAPWNGSSFGLSQTDPTTQDSASGTVNATFAGFSYSLNLNSVTLTQDPGNTGIARLYYVFGIDYQLGVNGLPLQATLFPNFLVSGNVENTFGSFASISGSIYYLDGNNNVLDSVNYNWTDNTPGNFNNVLVSGVAANGTTAALGANTDLKVIGDLVFEVDPASFSLETAPIPEASSGLLLGLAGVCGILWRRLAVKPTALPAN
jgi:hypothetical protein